MIDSELKKIALAAVCGEAGKNIEIEECANPQVVPYGFNSSEEILYRYSYINQHMIGGDKYLSVSRKTGEVHIYGWYGE